MKKYEKASSFLLPNNLPIIMRVDGRSFHTFTKNFEFPYDYNFIDLMNTTGISLCEEIPGCKFAYLQSDEINLIIYNSKDQEPWFHNRVEKLISVSASFATSIAMKWKFDNNILPDYLVSFDCRVFIIPFDEIINYFIWRQKDWERNSLIMLARKYYSQNRLNKKKKHSCMN